MRPSVWQSALLFSYLLIGSAKKLCLTLPLTLCLQTMLSDKIRETDWEITDETIQEQVARESYLQWVQDCQKRNRRPPVSIIAMPPVILVVSGRVNSLLPPQACTVTGPSCSSGTDQMGYLAQLSPSAAARRSSSPVAPAQAEQDRGKPLVEQRYSYLTSGIYSQLTSALWLSFQQKPKVW